MKKNWCLKISLFISKMSLNLYEFIVIIIDSLIIQHLNGPYLNNTVILN